MKSLYLYIVLFLFGGNLSAQYVDSFENLHPDKTYDNIHVQQLATDSLSTTFAIWVKLKVKMHKHEKHVENVYISDGKGTFYMADSSYQVKKGDLIVIPKNTWHGVDVSSKKPMKVISVQSPMFKGEDRIFKNY